MCFSENMQWNGAEASIQGWCLKLFGSKPNSFPSFYLQVFQKSLHVQENHSPPRTCQSHHCNIAGALSEAPYGVWGFLCGSSMRNSPYLRLCEKTCSNNNSSPVISSRDWAILSMDNNILVEIVFYGKWQICSHCSKENTRCCFLSYLRKKEIRLSFLIVAGILMFLSTY